MLIIDMESQKKLKKIIEESDNIVFFGGAGVSTESNIPDFRSNTGLYESKNKYKFPPEQILSHSFFINHTKEFYDYYKAQMIYPNAKPNDAHIALAKLEEEGKLKAIITQNIDNLHSKEFLELHGSVYLNYCMECNKFYDINYILKSKDIPLCSCGGIIKPDVVLYEESLDSHTLNKSLHYISQCDVLLVGGSSLTVYPSAGLIQYYHGDKLVLINKSATQYDRRADLIITEAIGKTLKNILL